jgi:hypothetical protein
LEQPQTVLVEFEESRAGTELTIAKLLLSIGDTDAAHAAFKPAVTLFLS